MVDYLSAAEKRTRKGSLWLRAALAISVGLNAYLLFQIDHQSPGLNSMERRLQNEIARLSDKTSGAFEVDQQRFLKIEAALEPAANKTLYPAQSGKALEHQSTPSLHAKVVEPRKDIAANESDSTLKPDAKEKEGGATTQRVKPKGQDESESLDAHVSAQVPFATTDSTVVTAANAKSVSIPIESTDAGKPNEVLAISSTPAIKLSVASAPTINRISIEVTRIAETIP